LSFTPTPIPVFPPVYTEFDIGTYEGWTFENIGSVSIQNTGGNPGGYCRITDGEGISQAIAPPKYNGNWSQLNDEAAVQVDFKISNFTGPLLISDYLIKISGPGGEAIIPMDSSVIAAFNQWQTFSYMINDTLWTILSGDWGSLLENVTEVRLITEFINGSEVVAMDNFRITNDRPIVDFYASRLFIFPADNIQFFNQSVFSPFNFIWSFGDDGTSTEENPFHTYGNSGLYDVQLIAENNFGSDTLLMEDYIEVASIPDSILFSDDFDDNDIHPAWVFSYGTWVEQNGNMVQTSNDFTGGYLGGCYAITGSRLWYNYRVSVDFQSTDNDKIGIVFNYQDELNFYLFVWQQAGSVRAIKKFVDGVESNLAIDDVIYNQSTWYHLDIETVDGQIRCSIDNTPIFFISESTFLTGKAGLYCHGNQNSYWDNFDVIIQDEIVGIEEVIQPTLIKNYSLSQNYPNPFNPSTKILYTIPNSDFVTLKIFDILGRDIQTLVNEFQKPGEYSVNFNAGKMPSGIYFYQLQAGNDFKETKKMILIR